MSHSSAEKPNSAYRNENDILHEIKLMSSQEASMQLDLKSQELSEERKNLTPPPQKKYEVNVKDINIPHNAKHNVSIQANEPVAKSIVTQMPLINQKYKSQRILKGRIAQGQ
jgi:hypothetical protein